MPNFSAKVFGFLGKSCVEVCFRSLDREKLRASGKNFKIFSILDDLINFEKKKKEKTNKAE